MTASELEIERLKDILRRIAVLHQKTSQRCTWQAEVETDIAAGLATVGESAPTEVSRLDTLMACSYGTGTLDPQDIVDPATLLPPITRSQVANLLSIAKRWVALDAGSWNVSRHASEKSELLSDTRKAIANPRSSGSRMSDTPKEADDSQKLLDAGWIILLRQNFMGSYTAVALKPGEDVADVLEMDHRWTDDFTPSQALYRLTEKVTTGRIA